MNVGGFLSPTATAGYASNRHRFDHNMYIPLLRLWISSVIPFTDK
jgi:hypothetical protein